jgi:hypothetical protein
MSMTLEQRTQILENIALTTGTLNERIALSSRSVA